MDAVEYTVHVLHFQDGSVVTTVSGAGDSQEDRRAIRYALEEAIKQLRDWEPAKLQ